MVLKKRTKFTPLALTSLFQEQKLPKSPSRSPNRSPEAPEKPQKKNKACKYGEACKIGERCVFLHPGETFTPPSRERGPKEPKEQRKTRMCRFLKKCGKGANCPFAHSEAELYVRECRYGNRCKHTGTGDPERDTCTFKHPPPPEAPEPPAEESLDLTEESFPSALGAVEPEMPSIDFSSLQDEDFFEKKASQEQQRESLTLSGTTEEIMSAFILQRNPEIKQYTFVL